MARISLILVGLIVVLGVLFPQPSLAQKGKSKKKPAAQHSKLVPADSIRNHAPTDTVGVVNGAVITYRDFNSIMSGYLKLFTKRSGNDLVTDSLYSQIVDSAWDRALSDILTEQEIAKRKLSMTVSEIKDSIVARPPDFLQKQFTDSLGNYHAEALRNALNSPMNDSIVHYMVEAERVPLETWSLIRSFAPNGQPMEMWNAYQAWLRKAKLSAHIVDNRLRFGFY